MTDNTTEDIYYGIWFLPTKSISAQGRLTVTDYYIDLHLTDPEHHSLSEDRDQESFSIIYGIGHSKEMITLYNCNGFAGNYQAKLMLYGDKHFTSIEDLKFKILSVNFPYFDKWINPGSFKKEMTDNGFVIKYENPQKIECLLDNQITLSIDFKCYVPEMIKKHKVNLHEHASVQLISNADDGTLLTDLLKYLNCLQQFTSFMVRDGANIEFVRVYSEPNEYISNPFMGTMVYSSYPFNKFSYDGHSERFLLNYLEIKNDFSELIKNWFNFALSGQHITSLILQDYFYRGTFDESRFLNLIRVLEIFHAFKFPDLILPVKDYKVKLDTIIDHIPDMYKKEVREHLQYKNEFTLDMRLQALINETGNIQVGLDNVYDGTFIKNVKHSRNYYTHYNPKYEKKALKGDLLIKVTESCRSLINFLILKHLGVPDKTLAKTFKFYFEHSYYSNYFN